MLRRLIACWLVVLVGILSPLGVGRAQDAGVADEERLETLETLLRPPPPGQFRALWVDAFGPGLKTPEEVAQLVADASAMNINALLAQVGRRGDCYCDRALMPRSEDPALAEGFDALEALIEQAHATGIQVHAWVTTTAIWNQAEPPQSPNHVFNQHGTSATGRDNWLMLRADGEVRGGSDYYLDPGHPEAVDYIVAMYTSLVENYAIDGIHLDRVRYPDFNEPELTPSWGYNPVSLERFALETDQQERPEPTDPVWAAWRREQVTNLVRRIYLEVKTLDPSVWVSAATITYGEGPEAFGDFEASRTYGEVLQDWVSWTREGFIDLNIPMNYKRDFDEAQALWYDQWNRFAAAERAPKYAAAGAAIYLNELPGSVQQIRYTLEQDALDGWAGYSYRTPSAEVNEGERETAEVIPELTALLSGTGGPYAEPAPWGPAPAERLSALYGRVTSTSRVSGLPVELLADGMVVSRSSTDASGAYGFAVLPRGDYTVRVLGQEVAVTLELAQVTPVPDLALP